MSESDNRTAMQNHPPRLTIGMPVYNGEEFVATAIESILAQTFTDFEMLIADNASTDRTGEICQEFASKDSRIRYHRHEKNIGAGPNFRYVCDQATSELFKWAAHDDIIQPEYLATCIAALDADPSIILAHTRTKIVDHRMKPICNYEYDPKADFDDPVKRFRYQIRGHQCYEIFGVMRRDVLAKIPPLGNYFSGDAVLLIRLVLLGRFHESPDFLFYSRQHAQQSERLRKDLQKYMEWFDPKFNGKITMPYWGVFNEYRVSIRNAPLKRGQRVICRFALLHWCFLRWRRLGRELVKSTIGRLLRLFRRSNAARPPAAHKGDLNS